MNTTAPVSEILRRVLVQPTGGIAGLVDDLFAVCLEHCLQLEWQADRCRIRSRGGDWEELRDVSLRKSVFRAILARVATLCNERIPGSVSPYGGQGELSAGASSTAIVRVAFVNTPETQQLELSPGMSSDLPEKRRKAEAWVNGYTATAVASVLGTSWLPGASTATLCTLEATMCYQIGRIYKVNYSMGEATATAGAIGVNAFVGKLVAMEAATFVPFLGWAAKPAIAVGIVKSMGQLVIKYFEDCAWRDSP